MHRASLPTTVPSAYFRPRRRMCAAIGSFVENPTFCDNELSRSNCTRHQGVTRVRQGTNFKPTTPHVVATHAPVGGGRTVALVWCARSWLCPPGGSLSSSASQRQRQPWRAAHSCVIRCALPVAVICSAAFGRTARGAAPSTSPCCGNRYNLQHRCGCCKRMCGVAWWARARCRLKYPLLSSGGGVTSHPASSNRLCSSSPRVCPAHQKLCTKMSIVGIWCRQRRW